jgi:radical SAM protein with 4Fe4S-binding SPASM domain
MNYAKNITEIAVDEIKSGYIAPSPTDLSDVCKNCAYKHVCLKNCADRKTRIAYGVDINSFKQEEEDE